MNLTFMFHRAIVSRYGNSLETFEEIFKILSLSKRSVLPGEKLPRMSYTLSFDDATIDFYTFIYPLLKKYNLKAILAVPSGSILDKAEASKKQRILEVQKHLDVAKLQGMAFCSWEEIREMQASNHVKIASHSMTHVNLTHAGVDLECELKKSKLLIEDKLQTTIDTFVAPYGQMNKAILKSAKNYYRYIYRIGSALNLSWKQKMLYRISCDQVENAVDLFKPLNKSGFFGKSILNLVRGC